MESPSPSTDMTTDCAMVKHPSSPSASPVGCGAITSVFVQGRAFSGHQFFRPHCAFFAAAASGIARKIDSSIFDNADKFLRLVKSLASQNPFLKQLSTITSQYRNFCQIQRRNHLMKSNSVSSQLNFAAVLPGDSVASVVVANGLMNFLNLYNTLLVVRLVLTWFPNTPPAIVSPLSTICDPYLNIFRGIIPPLGGTLDLSPILAFLVLNAFTSASAALPAELPPPVGSKLLQERSSSPIEMYDEFTSSQKKWMRRMLHGGDRSSKNPKKNQ